jgi:DNA modification methylase
VNLLPTFAQRGDIAPLLNRIHHCDALALLKRLPDASVDMVLTDIPYGEVNYSNETLRSIRKLHKGNADTVTFDLEALLIEIDRVSKYWVYMFCGIGQISQIRSHWMQGYMVRLAMWVKTNPSPMNGQLTWMSGMESCVVIRKQNAKFNKFCELPLWHFPTYPYPEHPTAKPIDLFKYLIESSSNEGDLILDPFSGSGTSAIAAKTLNRRFICGDSYSPYVRQSQIRLSNTDPFLPTTFKDGSVQLSLFSA